jgi:protein-S-isoprenylcysteine O-methyltransferase Ste14
MYSYLLVFAQFAIIIAMVLLGHGVLASVAGMTVFAFGLLFGLWAMGHNRLGNFNVRPDIKEGCSMVDGGPYRYVRHPMYTSVLVMMLGVLISTPVWTEWLLFVLLFGVLSAKAKREERLWCGHDPAYGAYREKTKMFLPFVW